LERGERGALSALRGFAGRRGGWLGRGCRGLAFLLGRGEDILFRDAPRQARARERFQVDLLLLGQEPDGRRVAELAGGESVGGGLAFRRCGRGVRRLGRGGRWRRRWLPGRRSLLLLGPLPGRL